MTSYNILIGDDHVLIVNGLKDFLLPLPAVNVVDVALNANEVLQLLENKTYDIVFLDLHFGKTDGRDLAKQIITLYPSIVTAALTSYDDKETIKSTIHSGFKAYFMKSDALTEIQKWIESDDFDTIFLSKQTSKSYSNQEFGKDNKEKTSIQLTSREKEVLHLLTEEYTTKKIAEKLFLSEKTIENYRSNLMLKLDVTNVVGLVKKTILLGLLH